MMYKIYSDVQYIRVTVSEVHIHTDEMDYSEKNTIEKIKKENPIMGWKKEDVGKYYANHSISGGRHECVWNNYSLISSSFVEALLSLHEEEFFVGVKTYEELDNKLKKSIL